MLSTRLVLGLVIAAVTATLPRAAHADGAFRTVLVIDASSSMRRTDPHDLRKVAAELFVDLSRSGDQIAVTGFDERARQSTGQLIRIDGMESRQRLKEAIRVIGNDGKWTDFTAGLAEAQSLLASAPRRPGDQDLIVFLTDGRCEPDPEGPIAAQVKTPRERESLCQEVVLGDVVASLGGARIYAIGLSKGAPAPFLEELGRRTGGQGVVTLDASALPRLFADVYARLLGSQLQDGDIAAASSSASFEVYESARTLDLAIVGRTDRTETLRDPTGVELGIDNRDPDAVYFAGATEYRFYKIRDPRPGTWTIEVTGKSGRHFAALQHFDLELTLVDAPAAVEHGRSVTLRAQLASSAGTRPPMEFLARHAMFAAIRAGEAREPLRLELGREDDGTFAATYTPAELGAVGVSLALEPRAGGVLSRQTAELATIEVIPPVHLQAAPVRLEPIKQGQSGAATLSMDGSKVGVPLGLDIALAGDDGAAAALTLRADALELAPEGERALPFTLEVSRDAPAGAHTLSLTITPGTPEGFADRAVTVPLTVEIVALTFWERHGTLITRGAGALGVLLVLIGLLAPARFPRRAILYHADVRDADLIRRSSYPLGTRARRGFYRGARVPLGVSGPVKTGGLVLVFARGGAVWARPLAAGASVLRVPLPDEDSLDRAAADSDDDRPRVPLQHGAFRMAPGVAYEVAGSGLVIWYK